MKEYDDALLNSPTPLWDKLVGHQMPDVEVKDLYEAMIGRLFVPLGLLDNWQVAMFLKGDANTGKSTMIDLVARGMFPIGTVGTLSANQEQTFGLEGLYEKRMMICPDIKEDFGKVLDITLLQSMVSGEAVSIARK
jgi:phage/plasmid-associated DNA primase